MAYAHLQGIHAFFKSQQNPHTTTLDHSAVSTNNTLGTCRLCPRHSPRQASFLQCSSVLPKLHPQLSPAPWLSPDLVCWHPIPFPIPYTFSDIQSPHVSNPSLAHWPDTRQRMSWQVRSQMHNHLLASKHTFSQLCLAGREVPAEVRAEPSLHPPQLGITGLLPAAKSWRIFREILLPNCLNVAPGLRSNRGLIQWETIWPWKPFFLRHSPWNYREIVNSPQTKHCKAQKFSANLLYVGVQLR